MVAAAGAPLAAPERARGTYTLGPMTGEMRRERKVVTALFADLVGSTALTESMDPEDAMDLLGAAISRIVLVVEDLGGTVKDLAGDGVLALFGAPLAHEDDVERAVHAGLRIVELFDGDDAPELAVRVGIDTGLVVLGPVGAGSHVEYGATGDTVNSAARLQAAAEPGSVLVGTTSRRLAERSFEWGPRRDLTLKGKAGAVAAWPVVAPVIDAVAPGHDVPLVDRRAELADVSEAVDTALAGHPGLLVVIGEGGVGKSRLLEEARRAVPLSSSEFSWVVLTCASYEQDVPFAPLRRLLGGSLGIGRGTEPQVAAGAPGSLHPFRVTEAVDRIVCRMASRGPVVIVFENLQWADRSTLQLIDHLVARSDDLPCLLVLTGRPQPEHPIGRWADLAGRGTRRHSSAVSLGPLGPEEAEALLAAHVGVGTLPIDLERALLDTAEGNPFFLEELVRALVDSGALVAGRHGWQHDPEVVFTVPPTLERLVRERLDRLPEKNRQLIVTAAAVGRAVDADLLADLGGVGPAEVDVQLQDLARSGLLERVEDQWRFAHPVVRDTAYNSLLRKARGGLHRRIAEALSQRAPEDHAALARHWWEAGEVAVAGRLAEQAARRSLALGLSEEAARQYEMAVKAAEATGTLSPDLLLTLADARRLAGLLPPALETYERAHRLAGDDVAALAAGALGYEDTFFATRHRRSPSDPTIPMLESAVRALGDEVSGRRVRTLAALGRALSYAGRTEEGSTVATGAVELARRAGDPGAAAYAILAWRTDRLGPACLAERVPMAEEALDQAEASGDDELWIEAARALFVDLLASARRTEADALLDRLEARILARRQPFHLWYVGMWRFQQALLDGDLRRAATVAGEFRRQGRRTRYRHVDDVYAFQQLMLVREGAETEDVAPLFERLAASDHGPAGKWPALFAALHAATGRVGDARRALDQLLDDRLASVPDDQSRAGLLALTAEAVVAAGTSDHAGTVADMLRPWTGQAIVVGTGAACIGSADHYLGILEAHAGRSEPARDLLRRGRDQHAALRSPPLVARSDRALANVVRVEHARS